MTAARSRIAVVTGAGRGIGLAIALDLSQRGYEIWAVGRAPESFSALRPALGQARWRPFCADLSQREATLKLAEELRAQPVSILVNNAGVAHSAPFKRHSLQAFDEELQVNTVAPFVLSQAVLPGMMDQGFGRIINIASTAGLRGAKYTTGYCASKHAVVGFTKALALECAQTGVTVNAICPGWTDTDMVTRSAQTIAQQTGRSETHARETLAQLNPMGRLVKPEEVARLCGHLTTPEAAAITGAALTVDGGESI